MNLLQWKNINKTTEKNIHLRYFDKHNLDIQWNKITNIPTKTKYISVTNWQISPHFLVKKRELWFFFYNQHSSLIHITLSKARHYGCIYKILKWTSGGNNIEFHYKKCRVKYLAITTREDVTLYINNLKKNNSRLVLYVVWPLYN